MKQFISETLDLLSLPQTKVALLGVLGSVATPFAMPAAYQDRVGSIVAAICTLSTLLVAGISYERGKQAEGTVSPGSAAPPPPTVVNVPLPTQVATLPLQPEKELSTLDAIKNFTTHTGNVAKTIAGLILIGCLFATGCQQPPLTQADLATVSMDSAVKVLIVARHNHYIADSDKDNISAVLHAADAALHTYVSDAEANPNSTQTQLDAAFFWSTFANIEPYVVKYATPKQIAPTTQKAVK